MGDSKIGKEGLSREFSDNEVWRVTDGAEKVVQRDQEFQEHLREVHRGLEKCSVCGSEAKICLFGLFGRGVWVGCDRTEECCRNIEYHDEGWSVDEVAECWNHRNRGLNYVIRKIKRWFRKVFRVGERERRRKEREEKERAKEEERKRRERFGIGEPKKIGIIRMLISMMTREIKEEQGKEK